MNVTNQPTRVESNVFLKATVFPLESVGTADIQYQCRRSHLSTCHFVDLSVQFRHQHLGKRRDAEIFCFQISVANTVKSCRSVEHLRIKLTAFTFVSLATQNNENADIISKRNSTSVVANTFRSRKTQNVC